MLLMALGDVVLELVDTRKGPLSLALTAERRTVEDRRLVLLADVANELVVALEGCGRSTAWPLAMEGRNSAVDGGRRLGAERGTWQIVVLSSLVLRVAWACCCESWMYYRSSIVRPAKHGRVCGPW